MPAVWARCIAPSTPPIDRDVALKLLHTNNQEQRFYERFVNEARIQSHLQHPNIAALYDFIRLDGKPCIVMEYVDGELLSQRIQAEDWSTTEAAGVFRQVVAAIHYIHSNGVVHRDIKTSNIKINASGEVKLLDFGIATELDAARLTKEGSWIGTLQYLAPEQLSGERGGAPVDIWALGILLYEMMTGRLPFSGDTVSGVMRQVNAGKYVAPIEHNTALPPEADAIIQRCLQKKPTSRYTDTASLLADAERFEQAMLSGAPPPPNGLRGGLRGGGLRGGGLRGGGLRGGGLRGGLRTALRQHWPLGLAGGALLALLGVVLVMANRGLPVPQTAPDHGSCRGCRSHASCARVVAGRRDRAGARHRRLALPITHANRQRRDRRGQRRSAGRRQ